MGGRSRRGHPAARTVMRSTTSSCASKRSWEVMPFMQASLGVSQPGWRECGLEKSISCSILAGVTCFLFKAVAMWVANPFLTMQLHDVTTDHMDKNFLRSSNPLALVFFFDHAI